MLIINLKKMRNKIIILLTVLLSTAANSQPTLPPLRTERPRILIKSDTFERVQEQALTDTLLQRYIGQVVARADQMVEWPLPVYDVSQGNMLDISRDCLDRTLTLVTAFRLTTDERYAQAAKQLLLTVSRFRDWDFYHFLDVAEMANAVAIGYDWLNDWLDSATLDELRLALIRNALVPGMAVYGVSPWQYWLKVDHNWNQVCNGGLAIAALAIADTDPVYAEHIVPRAIENIPYAMASYAPDGAWGEGVSYWFYATRYTVYCLATLLASLGTDFGLSEAQGFSQTGYFPIHMTTPAGSWFSYADINMNNGSKPLPVMFWIAQRFGNSHFSQYEHLMLRRYEATALDVLYYTPPATAASLPLDASFDGNGSFVTMRETWSSQDGLFVAVSGGDNRINHGHLDKGSFELEQNGVKWVRDLGSDNYFLPGYWEKEEGGRRWRYFRMNSEGHAVPIINGHSQHVEADTRFSALNLNTDEPSATIDLTEAYAGMAAKVERTFRLTHHRRALLVDDRYECSPATRSIRWQVITRAHVNGGGRHLLLLQDGHRLHMSLLTPGLRFRVESACRKAPEASNDGFSIISIDIPPRQTVERISVLFAPPLK